MMIALILLLVSVIFQINANWIVLGDELNKNSINEERYDELIMAKRYLGALAKHNGIPIHQRNYYMIPSMVSQYDDDRTNYVDRSNLKNKRYLDSLEKNGNSNFGTRQQKKNAAELENEDGFDEFRFPYKDDIPNSTIMKEEMINSLKPVILQYLNEFKKKYDPRKVDLFLENLANAIYDQNEEISMDEIKTLVYYDYFQPEENVESRKNELLKRNIQSLARDFNISFSGISSGKRQTRPIRSPSFFTRDEVDVWKRNNLEAIMKNKSFKRYLGTMAKNHNLPVRLGNGGKRDANENFVTYKYGNPENKYLKNMGKRHTMYDINEPYITLEYPSQVGEQNDYNDYAEQMGQDAAISIDKRYIGALARSGWLPQGFTLRSAGGGLSSSAFEKKRHIGALAKLGWISNVQESPAYYYRGGRGRNFRTSSFRGPRAYFLKSENKHGRCQCKRNSNSSWNESSWSDFPRLDNWPARTPRMDVSARQTTDTLEKRFLLIPAVDYFILRNLYPQLVRQPVQ